MWGADSSSVSTVWGTIMVQLHHEVRHVTHTFWIDGAVGQALPALGGLCDTTARPPAPGSSRPWLPSRVTAIELQTETSSNPGWLPGGSEDRYHPGRAACRGRGLPGDRAI